MRQRAFRLLLVLLAGLCIWPVGTARAQGQYGAASYINPFPESDVYRLQAYGDAFADGLLAGLADSFAGDSRVEVARKARTLGGLMKTDFDDDMRNEENSREPLHIAVIMVGIWDRVPIRLAAGKRGNVGSAEWREEYGRRVDRLIKVLRRKNVAIYWVGQPLMRRNDLNDDAQVMNDVVRQKAYLNGVKYIDIQAQFADDAGNYSAYGPDLSGANRLLREADGITFTQAGNRKLAHFIEQELKRDLLQARSERDIPLAGSELEQKRISGLKPRAPSTEISRRDSTTTARETPSTARTAAAMVSEPGGEQKADNGRITLRIMGPTGRPEMVTLDLVRPAIPAAVVSLLNRKDAGERTSQMGEVVADEIGGGLVVLSSITPSAPASAVAGAQRRLAPSQTPYYAVLVKGERLAPKPGRADDFSWPRREPEYGFVNMPSAVAPASSAPAPTRRNPRLGARE